MEVRIETKDKLFYCAQAIDNNKTNLNEFIEINYNKEDAQPPPLILILSKDAEWKKLKLIFK